MSECSDCQACPTAPELEFPQSAALPKAVALLELIQDTHPTDAKLVAQCLYDRVDRGNQVAALYFNAQRPSYTQLVSVSCGRVQNRPACLVQAQTRYAGYLLSARWVTVRAIGYLANGVTRGDQ